VIINTTFCGGYAGPNFAVKYPDLVQQGYTCNSYVAENPSAFKDAYWELNYIKIYGAQQTVAVKLTDAKRRLKSAVEIKRRIYDKTVIRKRMLNKANH